MFQTYFLRLWIRPRKLKHNLVSQTSIYEFEIEIHSNASNLLAGRTLSGWAINKASLFPFLIIAGMSGIVIAKATTFHWPLGELIERGSFIVLLPKLLSQTGAICISVGIRNALDLRSPRDKTHSVRSIFKPLNVMRAERFHWQVKG